MDRLDMLLVQNTLHFKQKKVYKTKPFALKAGFNIIVIELEYYRTRVVFSP